MCRRGVVIATLAAGLMLVTAAVAEAKPKGAAFPPGFLWGTAVAGFQTEAGASPAGNDPNSDWWAWLHDPQNIADHRVSGDLPEDGPGSYDLYETDFKLAQGLKNNAIRMGIEWSRIFPHSTKGVDTSGGIDENVLHQLDALANQDVVNHYRKVLVAARKRHLTPFITLEHFTLPLWIHDPIATRAALQKASGFDDLPAELGSAPGWLDPSIPDEFAKYAAYVAWKYGDLVDFWTPINEPIVVVTGGFVSLGISGAPPGVINFAAARAALLNMISANQKAYDAVHAFDRFDADGDGTSARVGLVQNLVVFAPADPAKAVDVEGARTADYLFNRLFINAAVRGEIDANADTIIQPGEVHPELAGKADFIGVNYYLRGRVAGLGSSISSVLPINFVPTTAYRSPLDPAAPPCPTECTDIGWEIYPQGLRDVLELAGTYGLPVYITENGIADANDDQRPSFLLGHLSVLQQAIADGVADVRGYFHWSLIDNLEWNSGYFPKFGLYSYDHDTLQRTARPSASLYRQIAHKNALPAQ
jgi:beta-glucosidase/6-phospho-beta-glucosidase/beta-galactosidase